MESKQDPITVVPRVSGRYFGRYGTSQHWNGKTRKFSNLVTFFQSIFLPFKIKNVAIKYLNLQDGIWSIGEFRIKNNVNYFPNRFLSTLPVQKLLNSTWIFQKNEKPVYKFN